MSRNGMHRGIAAAALSPDVLFFIWIKNSDSSKTAGWVLSVDVIDFAIKKTSTGT